MIITILLLPLGHISFNNRIFKKKTLHQSRQLYSWAGFFLNGDGCEAPNKLLILLLVVHNYKETKKSEKITTILLKIHLKTKLNINIHLIYMYPVVRHGLLLFGIVVDHSWHHCWWNPSQWGRRWIGDEHYADKKRQHQWIKTSLGWRVWPCCTADKDEPTGVEWVPASRPWANNLILFVLTN
jgi:hypothetical protein